MSPFFEGKQQTDHRCSVASEAPVSTRRSVPRCARTRSRTEAADEAHRSGTSPRHDRTASEFAEKRPGVVDLRSIDRSSQSHVSCLGTLSNLRRDTTSLGSLGDHRLSDRSDRPVRREAQRKWRQAPPLNQEIAHAASKSNGDGELHFHGADRDVRGVAERVVVVFPDWVSPPFLGKYGCDLYGIDLDWRHLTESESSKV